MVQLLSIAACVTVVLAAILNATGAELATVFVAAATSAIFALLAIAHAIWEER